MNIPQGYKQTELGIIPEEWDVKTIGDYYEVTSSKRIFQSQWRHIGIPFYRAREIVVLAENRKVDNELFIDQELYDLYKRQYGVPQAGDVLVTGVGTLGRLYVVQSNDSPFYFKDGNIIWFKNKGYNSVLLSYLYQTGSVINQITDNSGGSTVGTYTIQNAINTKIITPNLPAEQDAIAEALSDVDALIAALDKKIAKKRLIKQGAMIRLLGGKGNQFRTRKIKDIVSIKKGDMLTSEQYIAGNIPVIAGGKSAAGYHNIANRPANTITISASGASAGYVAFHDYPIFATDCSTIESSKSYNIKYIYYLLTFYQFELYALQTGGAQPHVHPNDIYDLNIYYNGNIEDQRNIATILSDMDKEIANLEARRDKYKLIKSGMMQKLLTGQIRLVKPLAPIIPLAAPETKIREIPLKTHIVAGHIVNTLYQSSGWGRTKLQKTLHLVGYHCQLDFGNEYIRNTAGPDDQTMMNHIDSKFKQYRHVKIEAKKDNGKTRYNYIPTAMIDELEQVYETYPQRIRNAVDSLINKIKKMDLAGAEILSTLYAVWNNRLIKGEPITDNLLISDFYAWSAHKADFEETRVRKALDYMREQNIIPVGWGKYIDKR
ncbi:MULTISPECIES: restriction endonuclease subunit S [Alistipes]|uniref:restriction endonuclease subunit S n=1 Tax=Alistipes TaxID=239759 RepID=UPI001C3E7975|nr:MULTISPECIES: restriction endonuclease subunit S [Alistipes]MCR2031780.1 restriction endonuclease subunit S [Alistipes timonensis]